MDGRLLVERINGPFLFELKGTPAEYKAGLDRAIEKGWLVMHESGTYCEVHPGRRGSVRLAGFATKKTSQLSFAFLLHLFEFLGIHFFHHWTLIGRAGRLL